MGKLLMHTTETLNVAEFVPFDFGLVLIVTFKTSTTNFFFG